MKVLRGTVDTRTVNPHEPQVGVDELQFMPGELSEVAQKHWAKIRPMLVESGIAGNSDRMSLMMLCDAWAEYLDIQEKVRKTGPVIKGANGHPVKSPWFEASNQSFEKVRRMLVEFGMTPSSRSKIVSTGRKPTTKRGGAFDDL